jgi:DNA-binding LytR/AlgR family response regulator
MKISTEGQILFFKDKEVIRFEAKGNDTIIHFYDGSSSEIDEPIDSIAKQFKNQGFIRIHKNHLVNVIHITGIPDKKPGFIEINRTLFLPIFHEQRKIIIQLISAHLKT